VEWVIPASFDRADYRRGSGVRTAECDGGLSRVPERSGGPTERSTPLTIRGPDPTGGRSSLSSDGTTRESSPQRRHVAFADPEDWIVLEAYEKDVLLARQALQCRDYDTCFVHLERAHVLSQRKTFRHTYVHGLMLVAGMRRRDFREVIGQVPRMLASVLFSRLWVPRGNTGRARVSALKQMPVPEDLRHLIT